MSFLGDTRRAFSSRDYSEEYYESDRDYDEDDEEYEEEKSIKGFFAKLFGRNDDYDEETEEDKEEERSYSSRRRTQTKERTSSYSRNTSSTVNYAPMSAENVEIVALSHFNFPNAADIVKEVKKGKVILFDISTLETTEDARRVVDYIGGAAEGMDCNFEKLFPSVFGISPKNITITAKKSRLR